MQPQFREEYDALETFYRSFESKILSIEQAQNKLQLDWDKYTP
jgi:hypothetical protein